MSTATTSGAAAATAVAASTTTPPATLDTKADGTKTVAKDIRNRILSGARAAPPATANGGVTEPTAEEKAKAEAAAKAKADADAAAATAAAEAGTKRERVKKVKEGPALPAAGSPEGQKSVETIVREVHSEITKESAAAAATSGQPELDPDVRREIELAAFAEKKHPDRYTGLATKVRTFFAANDQLIAAKAKELGGAKSAEFKDWVDGDEYKAWIAENRPAYARGDKAKIVEDQIADRAREEARKEFEPQMRANERKIAEIEHAPEINAKANRALTLILTDAGEQKDPALAEFTKDPLKFGEAHPEEARLIAGEANEALELIREVYRIERNLTDFDPKRPTVQQQQLRTFTVERNAELRAKHPNGVEMQDGKILVDAETYHRLQLHKDPKYRLFNGDEIAGMLAATRNAQMLEKLKQRRDGVAKSFYAVGREAAAGGANGKEGAAAATREEAGTSPTAGTSAAPAGKGKPHEDPMKIARRKALTGR